MRLISTRMLYLMGFLLIAVVLGASYYLQAYDGMTPCPLCILQRFTMIILGIFFLLGAFKRFKKAGQFFLSVLSILFSGFGIFLAGRQVWIQHLPPNQNADCGASLEYMLQALPIKQVIQKIFSGSAECSVINWRLWHLSLAEWSLISFVGLFCLAFWIFCRSFAKTK